MEVPQEGGGRDPPGDHVDAQGPAAGSQRGRGALLDPQQLAGVGQERLPVGGQPRASRRAREQPHADAALERGDALGHRLLGERELGGGELELPGVGDGDERADGIEIHNRWL